jgi:sugar/nucleoside kinase (ribokinase family)
MKKFDVVGLGIATQDILALTPRLPKSNDCFPIPTLDLQGGGPVATALVTLSRLGSRCSYLGPFGPDQTGKQIMEELKQYGVDVSNCPVRSEGVSSASVVLVEQTGGNRSILFQKSTAAELDPEEVQEEWISSARALHLDGFYPQAALKAAKIAHENGVLVSFDGGAGESMWEGLEELLSLVDVMVVARKFAQQATEEEDPLSAGAILLDKYKCQQVVITDGANGCWFWDRKYHMHQPSFLVDVVDTTGAGDTFHGAYLFATLQEQWRPAFRLKFASAVAALKCTQLGGRRGIPTLEETTSFIARTQTLRL